MTTLSARALNRALLERQWLLGRVDRSPADALDHLVGLQAQAPLAPYVALWSRLQGFDPGVPAAALEQRRAVRTTLMRVTIHLVNADDALALRPFVQPICAQVFASSGFAREVDGVDLDELLARSRALVAERPHTRKDLSDRLAERWPDVDAPSLAYAFTFLEPLVHVPPRGMWGTTGPQRSRPSRRGRAPARPRRSRGHRAARLTCLRPATVADVAKWSRVAGYGRRRGPAPRRGRSATSIPGASTSPTRRCPTPTPGPDALPAEFDNVLLSHADRTRAILPTAPARRSRRQRRPHRDVLVDGFLRGTWRSEGESSASSPSRR